MTELFLSSTTDDCEADDDAPTKESGKWRQYYTCFVMFVVCISRGLTFGWASPMIQILEKEDSPVGKMDDSQINILQTIPQVSGMLGSFSVAFLLIRFGTKTSGYLEAVLLVGGWLVVLVANEPVLLYVGRFLTGMAQVDVVGGFYLSEVVHDCRRGMLISSAMFGMSLGGLLGFIFGSFCDWVVFNAICLSPAAVFLLLLYPIPESPEYLARRGRTDAAARSYSWFFEIGPEPARRKVTEILNFRQPKVSWAAVFTVKSNRKALTILTFIVAFTPLCGTSVIGAYTSKIFETAKSSISPNYSAIMMSSISFTASLCGAVLIDRAGRRFLLIACLGLMCLSHSAVAAYFIVQDRNWADFPCKELLLYGGVGVYSAACIVTVWTVSSTIAAEMVPNGVKAMLWTIAGNVGTLTSVATLQAYWLITAHLPYCVYFIQAAAFSAVAVAIAWFIVPETKEKSLAEITAELNGIPHRDSEIFKNQQDYVMMQPTGSSRKNSGGALILRRYQGYE